MSESAWSRNPGEPLRIYVPRAGSYLARHIQHGSGIVGSVEGDRLRVDYEGGRWATNVRTWADRLRIAAGRHIERYPTIARAYVDDDQLLEVGLWYHLESRAEVTLDVEEFADWIDLLAHPEELRITGA